jgi:hypothetical protein
MATIRKLAKMPGEVLHISLASHSKSATLVVLRDGKLWEERYVKRMWPDEYAFMLNDAEEVDLQFPSVAHRDGSTEKAFTRRALKVRISQQDFEKIWHLSEARYRLTGRFSGKAITLITNNPHYQNWHPSEGGSVENVSDSGQKYTTHYVIVHFLLDDVRESPHFHTSSPHSMYPA